MYGSSGNAFVTGEGGLRFKYRAGQIGHSVANDSSPLQHFKRTMLSGRKDTEVGAVNSLHSSAYYSEYNERFNL